MIISLNPSPDCQQSQVRLATILIRQKNFNLVTESPESMES